MNKAEMNLEHSQAKVTGPEELVSLVRSAVHGSSHQEEANSRITALLSEWFVECSVTGDPIPVTELRYWNVEKQEAYKSPEIMPFEDRYNEEIVTDTLKRWGIICDKPKQ